MPEPQPHTPSFRRFPRHSLAIVAMLVCALGIAAPLAAAKTIEFRETDQPAAVPDPTDGMFGGTTAPATKVPLGTTKNKLVIRTSKQDRQALKNQKTINELDTQREESVETGNAVGARIEAIDTMLRDTEAERDELRAEIEQRLVEQYQNGAGGDIAFLLAGGASDLLDRAHTLRDTSKRDAELYDRFELTLDRLDELRAVLEELRTIEGERTERLGDRIDRLGQTLVDARGARSNTSLPVLKTDKGEAEAQDQPAGGGTWYVMSGAFEAGLFLPGITGLGTGQYDGGNTLTPRQAPTPDVIGAVMQLQARGAIELSPTGLQDVTSGQIDNRVLRAMIGASQQFGFIRISMLKTGHSVYTAGGNISAHSYGCAMDIGTIGHTYIQPGAQTPGGQVEQAVKFFAALPADLAPHQVISLFSLGGPTMAMSDHGDHIHVGYSC